MSIDFDTVRNLKRVKELVIKITAEIPLDIIYDEMSEIMMLLNNEIRKAENMKEIG